MHCAARCGQIVAQELSLAPAQGRAMAVRFVAPTLPGDTIRVEMFDEGETIRFRAWAIERQTLVLDRGACEIAGL